jgi:5'-nucleotidase
MTDVDELKTRLRAAPLRIGISTRALFDLEEEHKVFEEQGVHAYIALQHAREGELIRRGTAFEVVDRLLRLNEPDSAPYVQIVVLSRNSPDLSLRAFKSIEHHGLPVVTGSFTSGAPIGPYIPAWEIDLFLSNDHHDVKSAIEAKCAAARLGKVPERLQFKSNEEVRIAFDGDAVVFSAESDRIFSEHGCPRFARSTWVPMA